MDLGDQLKRELKASLRQRNPSRYFYYKQLLADQNLIAAVSWERFRGSWAHAAWTRKHDADIRAMIEQDNARFGTWN